MKPTSIIVIGILSYFIYTQYNKSDKVIIDSKNLYNIKEYAHTKDYNPVYDPKTDNFLNIKHHFTNQVETRNYATM
jgi:hypothetical protein